MYWSAAMCINGFYLVVLEYKRERERDIMLTSAIGQYKNLGNNISIMEGMPGIVCRYLYTNKRRSERRLTHQRVFTSNFIMPLCATFCS